MATKKKRVGYEKIGRTKSGKPVYMTPPGERPHPSFLTFQKQDLDDAIEIYRAYNAKHGKFKGTRGLRGTPSEHARAFASAIHVARKPISYGCTASERAFGEAAVHYQGAPSARRREAMREADDILGRMCICQSDTPIARERRKKG